MKRSLKKKCSLRIVTKTADLDEVVMSYGEPTDIKLTLQYMSDSKIGIEMYGQDAQLWVKVYLDKGQTLEIDDLVIYENNVYRVKGEPIPYLKHRTVMMKWDSKNLI